MKDRTHSRTGNTLAGLLAIFLCTFAIISTAAAQSYQYYHSEDSVFHIGATNANIDTVYKELQLDFARLYGTLSPSYLDTARSNPSQYDMAHNRDSNSLLLGQWMQSALQRKWKLIAPIAGVALDLRAMRALENYGLADTARFHNLQLEHYNWEGAGRLRDTTLFGLAMGVTMPNYFPLHDTLLAARPTYNADYGFFYGDPNLYRNLGIDSGQNRASWYRISFAIRADSITAGMLDNTLLGYAILYRRSRTHQENCKCSIFEPFDTILVRKSDYVAADVADAVDAKSGRKGYKEVGKTINFARGTAFYKRDSSVWLLNTAGKDSFLLFRQGYYTIDTIQTRLMRTVDSLNDTVSDIHRRVLVRWDSIEFDQVGLRVEGGDSWVYGTGREFFGYQTCNEDSCKAYISRGLFPPGSISERAFNSDFNFHFYSTGRVPITFLRSRIAQDAYEDLRHGKLDSAFRRGGSGIRVHFKLPKLIRPVLIQDTAIRLGSRIV